MPYRKKQGNYPTNWDRYRNAIMRRDDFMCQECGKEIEYSGGYDRNKPQHFRVHHKDGDKSNNKFNNLILLCMECHGLIHRRMNALY
jgi:5-methylcytosine-specific restriction endonuclease McrA